MHLLYNEKICSIKSIYILTICSFVYIHKDQQHYLNQAHDTRTVTDNLPSIPSVKKNINQRFVNYLAPKFYNIIPRYIRDVERLSRFKKLCKTFIAKNVDIFP